MKSKITMIVAILMLTLFVIPDVTLAQPNAKKTKSEKKFKNKKIKLFNGKDLTNWEFYLRNSSIDPATIFTVQNGLIHMNSNPWGFMRTKDSYSNYKLHVEWLWPKVATNSGVFIHYQPRDAKSYKWIECNLVAGGAGDFICERGVDMDEHINKSSPFVKKMAESSEKEVGEWNTMEIICIANSIEVYVNGVLQNKATNINIAEGSIGLQVEGQDVEFRNVFLTELKK